MPQDYSPALHPPLGFTLRHAFGPMVRRIKRHTVGVACFARPLVCNPSAGERLELRLSAVAVSIDRAQVAWIIRATLTFRLDVIHLGSRPDPAFCGTGSAPAYVLIALQDDGAQPIPSCAISSRVP
jgi:hypothetical protein